MLSTQNNKYSLKVSQPIDIINKNLKYINNNSQYINNNSQYINNIDSVDRIDRYNFNNIDSVDRIDRYNFNNQYKSNSDNANYKLDFNKFDPSKFSPPDDWTLRLKTRIKNYTDTNIIINKNTNNYIDYFFDNK